jgi:hemoglobin
MSPSWRRPPGRRTRWTSRKIEGTVLWKKPGAKKAARFTFKGTRLAPLYDRLGGLEAISLVVDEFVNRLGVNPVLNANPAVRGARPPAPAAYLKVQVSTLVCQVTGGPCKYTGRSMKDAHAHLHISAAEWDEMAKVFVGVLDEFKVPKADQQELLGIVASTRGDIVTR